MAHTSNNGSEYDINVNNGRAGNSNLNLYFKNKVEKILNIII